MKSAREFAYFCTFGRHYNIPFTARDCNALMKKMGIVGKRFIRRVDGSIDVVTN